MYQGNHAFAARLVERGVDLAARDRNGRQLLHAAVLAGQEALVDRLLAAGADPNGLTGPSRVEWKYESNFRAGRYEWPPTPPLVLAAAEGQPAIMHRLAAAGADATWRDAEGDGIVHAAAGSGVPEALAAALALSPDANLPGRAGETPLHRVLARAEGDVLAAMLAILARNGARADIADDRGETPAQIAADEHFRGRAAFVARFGST
jgi:ankyrin repeat protein